MSITRDLPDHPQYELAQKQMKGPGGLMSFVVSGGMGSAATVDGQFQLNLSCRHVRYQSHHLHAPGHHHPRAHDA